jgi:hypothetical protein
MVGADLNAQPFRFGAHKWWKDMVGRPEGGPGPAPGKNWTSKTDQWNNEPLQFSLARGLADVKPAAEVPFGWLALFLGAYVLLIGPIDYVVLRRLNRLEWTFITFTLITLLVTGAAWGVSQYLKGGDMLLRSLEIRTSRANLPGGRAEAVFGVYANKHTDLKLQNTHDNGATGMFWVPVKERRAAAARTVDLEMSNDGVWTSRAPVRIWTTDWFHSVWSDDRAAVISGRLVRRRSGGGVGGKLTLEDDRDWREVHLVYQGQIWHIEDWRAGDEILIVPGQGQQLEPYTKGWEMIPDTRMTPPEQFPFEHAAMNLLAVSVGRTIGSSNDFRAYHPWSRSLAIRPPADTALLIGLSHGGLAPLKLPGHDPVPEVIRIERVLIQVGRSR